jgi:hypothetical protein
VIFRASVFLTVLASAVLVTLLTPPVEAFAENTTTSTNRLGIETPQVLLTPFGDEYAGEVVFLIEGELAVELSYEIVDAWASEDGQRISLPPGSTPLTGKDRLIIGTTSPEYVPNGEVQRISVPLTIDAESLLRTPLGAGIVITLLEIEEKPGEKPLRIVASALSYVFGVHEDYDGSTDEFTSDILVSEFIVSDLADTSRSGLGSPRTFVENGKLKAAVETRNSGTLFGFVSHLLVVRKVGWWVDPTERRIPLVDWHIDEYLLVPGQSTLHVIPLTATVAGSTLDINLVEDWGIYDATLVTSRHSGFDTPSIDTETITIVVFPLRSAATLTIGALLLALLLFRWGSQRSSTLFRNPPLDPLRKST